jgi:hypothetical protein
VTAAGYIRSLTAGTVQYFEAVTAATATHRHPSREILLPSGRRIVVEKCPVSPPLAVALDLFGPSPVSAPLPQDLLHFETIPAGLADYF